MQLWSFIIVLTLAILLGVLMSHDPGYALFSYGDFAIEMPLWVSAIILVFVVIATLFLLWTINTLLSGSGKAKEWWKKHQALTARQQTFRGLLELAEGRSKNAERYLIQSASHNDTPIINYLSAAKAAEESGSSERRDQYLQLAFDASTGSDFAVRLTQAELQAEHGELKHSIRNLELLREGAPKHPKILRLLSLLYEKSEDWQALYALLPLLRKTQVLPLTTLQKLENKIYPAMLPIYAQQGLKPLIHFWEHSPESIQTHPHQAVEYAKLLVKLNSVDEAENVVRQLLKKKWDNQLVHFYGLIASTHLKKQLLFIESFLSPHTNEPILLLTAGRLCLKNQLWGKARDYLEKSLYLAPLPETYAELGQLMERLGLTEARDEYYKKGLLCATQTNARIPSNELLYLTQS